jgi:triosephosphate isomerase
MLILNFKTYAETTGQNCLKIVENLEKLNNDMPDIGAKFTCALPTLDLILAREKYRNINLMAQHVDPREPGNFTGWTTPAHLASYGIGFSIYNHREHRMWNESINRDIEFIQSQGVKLVVCCEDVEEARKLLPAKPFGIAYEPADLIGSGISVTTRPQSVQEFLEMVKGNTMAFIGAGVTTQEDVETCLNLGAEGVLLSTAFVKAENHYEKAKELATPFLK